MAEAASENNARFSCSNFVCQFGKFPGGPSQRRDDAKAQQRIEAEKEESFRPPKRKRKNRMLDPFPVFSPLLLLLLLSVHTTSLSSPV